MGSKIAILYATVDGQTLKICNEIIKVLEKDNEVKIFEVNSFDGKVADYDKFLIGSSIRYGVHNENIIKFINNNKDELDKVKSAFFSVNLVARKPEKNQPDTNPYVVKFFKSITWVPKLTTVFAGMLDYSKYSFFDRIMIQFIMWMTKGPTNKDAVIEYTDWKRVGEFAEELHRL